MKKLLLLCVLWPSLASAQIVFDTSTDGGLGNPVTSITWAHTTTGTDRMLAVCVFGDVTNDVITGVTYAGNALTLVDKALAQASGRWGYLYYMIAPTSGANNIIVSASSSIAIYGMASSYTGVHQTTPLDASNTGTDIGLSSSQTVSVTTTVDNDWTVMCTRVETGGSVPTAGAGTTLRQSVSAGLVLSDSNGALTPVGSKSLIINDTDSANWASIIAAFSPATGGGGGATPCHRSLLGVGCDLSLWARR